ncbi:hypothetical protein DXG01_000801 [Tephrocybe rancida]|nr:hypothetical protein DXG01_000801 [Tephrocybe rancida]
MSNFKRHRASSSQDSSASSASTASAQHPSKSSRTIPGQPSSEASSHPLLCTLPPTCNHRPTPLANSRELETHYATYHAHVCEQSGCGAVFPEARLLELHQTECHDPLAAVRKDRGEKIFACHLVSCPRLFSAPKTRRLHLIQAHGYPKEYFFSVTNKGVGGLLKKWGEGASLIRGEWKARGTKSDDGDLEDEDNDNDNDDMDGRHADHNDAHGHDGYPRKIDSHSKVDDTLDGLADTMGSLSLVPPSIRFGRGGKKGGFLQTSERAGFDGTNSNGGFHGRGRGRGGRGRGRGSVPRHHATSGMDVDPPVVRASRAPTLGHAGRGRAGIVHPPRGRGESRGTAV